jgi:hypothetical protein
MQHPAATGVADLQALRQSQRLQLPDVLLEQQLPLSDEQAHIAGAETGVRSDGVQRPSRPWTVLRTVIPTLQTRLDSMSIVIGERD